MRRYTLAAICVLGLLGWGLYPVPASPETKTTPAPRLPRQTHRLPLPMVEPLPVAPIADPESVEVLVRVWGPGGPVIGALVTGCGQSTQTDAEGEALLNVAPPCSVRAGLMVGTALSVGPPVEVTGSTVNIDIGDDAADRVETLLDRLELWESMEATAPTDERDDIRRFVIDPIVAELDALGQLI